MSNIFRFVAVFLLFVGQASAGMSMEHLASHFASAKTPTKEDFGEKGKVQLACSEYAYSGDKVDSKQGLILSELGIVHADGHKVTHYMLIDYERIGFYEDAGLKYISTLRITGGGIWISEWSVKMRKGVKVDKISRIWWKSAEPSIIWPS